MRDSKVEIRCCIYCKKSELDVEFGLHGNACEPCKKRGKDAKAEAVRQTEARIVRATKAKKDATMRKLSEKCPDGYEYISVAAAKLNLDVHAVNRMCHQGKIEYIRIGKYYFVRVEAA